jgi:hypothetical protein
MSSHTESEVASREDVHARSLGWWQFGILGALVLSVATIFKVVHALFDGVKHPVAWSEAAIFALAIAVMGFACGVVVWAGSGLHERLGRLGDAIVGAVVMVAFFTMCMLLFDPALLGPRFASGGLPMFGLAIVFGAIGGAWVAHDVRKHRARAPLDGEDEEDEGDA